MLSVTNLHVNYGAIRALHGVSLTVNEGEIVTLIGSNGAGKSTTLRAISGMLRPSAGDITYRGESIVRTPCHRLVCKGLCHAPEGRGIFANLTVRENLELGAFARDDGKAAIDQDRERALALFPRVKERLSQVAGTLSGGEQQMLAIARALMSRPRLLLLDEPSLGLAPQIVETIFKIIREINKPVGDRPGTTILLVEQNAHQALKVAHRAYVLQVGRVVMDGPAAELAAHDEVRKAYLGAH
jgi:branched-chain amino acid transport system ATP-binding protein